MFNDPWLLPLVAVVIAAASAFAVTPLSGRLAHRFGVLDHPDLDPFGKKRHERVTPYLGGVAIFCGVIAGSALLLVALGTEVDAVFAGFPLAIGVALLLGLIGLADDMRNMPLSLRLAAQFGASLAAWFSGFRVGIAENDTMNLILTIVWIVGITNAFNLLDNMDGLTAGTAGIAAVSFALMGVTGNMPALAIVAASLAGAAFGFLAHNRHPAKIFMGDAGSLFLGLLLALIGMRLRFENLVEVTFLVPVVVLGLPIFDTSLVVLSRLRHKRGVFQGGRDHVSHRLVQIGLPVPATVRLLYWACLCLGWLGFVITRADPQVAFMLLGLVFAMGLYLGRVLWKVPVYDVGIPAAAAEAPAEERVAYLAAVDNASDSL